MLEIKVQCDCGQKYKFDVEPINGRMPFVVNCPICGQEGTTKANLVLGQVLAVPTVHSAVPAGVPIGIASSSASPVPPPPALRLGGGAPKATLPEPTAVATMAPAAPITAAAQPPALSIGKPAPGKKPSF